MKYTARVIFKRYESGEVTTEKEYESVFEQKTPLENRNDAFKYVLDLEDVFEHELEDVILSLHDVTTMPAELKTGIYYESLISFYSSRLEDDVNLFSPLSDKLMEEAIEWYQIGLVEELIELSHFMSNKELDEHVQICHNNYIVLSQHREIVKVKVADIERVWIEITIRG